MAYRPEAACWFATQCDNERGLLPLAGRPVFLRRTESGTAHKQHRPTGDEWKPSVIIKAPEAERVSLVAMVTSDGISGDNPLTQLAWPPLLR